MTITLNGSSYTCPESVVTVNDLLLHLELDPTHVVVELNGNAVSRTVLKDTSLSSKDRVEIIHFVGGG